MRFTSIQLIVHGEVISEHTHSKISHTHTHHICHTLGNNKNSSNNNTAKGNDSLTTNDSKTDSGKPKSNRPLVNAPEAIFFVFRLGIHPLRHFQIRTQTIQFAKNVPIYLISLILKLKKKKQVLFRMIRLREE